VSLTNAWMSLSTARMMAIHWLLSLMIAVLSLTGVRSSSFCEGSGRRANPQKRQGEAGGAVRMPTTLLRRADAGLTQV